MIDPSKITNYNLTEPELEEVLIFWICVAGKTAATIAKGVEKLLTDLKGGTPFAKIKRYGYERLPDKLKECGIGCYTLKARSLWSLVNSDLDLRTCSLEELESIPGIGRKTSRCFVMHSRRGAKCAGLDTHILKFLRSKGHEVPTSTPGSKKKYFEIERLFLKYVQVSGQTAADFDLNIWRNYAKS
jgi:thermostable 8-oxoguanine DNA glycosylase